jgi:hypothetical protein
MIIHDGSLEEGLFDFGSRLLVVKILAATSAKNYREEEQP